jgi:hypothetical protein
VFVRQQPLLLDNRIEAMDYRNQILRLIGSKWSSPEAHIGGGGSSSPPPLDLIVDVLATPTSTYQREHQNRRRLGSHTIPSIVNPFVGPTCQVLGTNRHTSRPTAIVLVFHVFARRPASLCVVL